MRWLTRPLVEAIHADQLREHGGLPGLRDPAALESALERPRQRHHYDPDADLSRLAAALCHGLSKAHAFADGNKRVSLACLYTFLGLNGWELVTPEPAAVVGMLGVASGELAEEELAEWIRARLVAWEE